MRRIVLCFLLGAGVTSTTGCRLGFDALWNTVWGEDEAYYSFDEDGYRGTSNPRHDEYVAAQLRPSNSPNERVQHADMPKQEEARAWAAENRYE